MKLQVTLTNGTLAKAYEAPMVLYYVGHAGELHVDYSNGAPIRKDETYRAATIAPGQRATVKNGRAGRRSPNGKLPSKLGPEIDELW